MQNMAFSPTSKYFEVFHIYGLLVLWAVMVCVCMYVFVFVCVFVCLCMCVCDHFSTCIKYDIICKSVEPGTGTKIEPNH